MFHSAVTRAPDSLSSTPLSVFVQQHWRGCLHPRYSKLTSSAFEQGEETLQHLREQEELDKMSRAPPSSGGSRKISFNVSEQYDIQDVVGEGAYGVVCSALHKPSGQKVAIKKITP